MNALANLMSPAAVGASVGSAFKAGQAEGEKLQLRELVAEHTRNPADPGIVAKITMLSPGLGSKLQERQRAQQFNNAAADYYKAGGMGDGGAPARSGGIGGPAPRNALLGNALEATPPPQGSQAFQPNALTQGMMPPVQPGASFGEAFAGMDSPRDVLANGAQGMPGPISGFGGGTFGIDGTQVTPVQRGTDEGEQAAPDFSALGQPQSSADAAFVRMLSLDAKQAFAIDSEMRDRAADRLKIQRDAYGFAVSRLSGVSDAASYEAALADIASRIEPLGVEITDHLPARFPGPDGLKALRLSALDAKDQVSLFLREANIEADNERADRNTDSLIETRRGQLNETRRNNEGRLSNQRRGQDIGSRDRRRGQDLRGSGREKIVAVKTPKEAMALPPGTKFRTPDGKVKVRP